MAGLSITLTTSLPMALLQMISVGNVSFDSVIIAMLLFLLTLLSAIAPKFQGENFYKNRAIVDEIKKLSSSKGCSISQIALAWVADQGMIAIPGTTKAPRLESNWASWDIELTDDERQEMRRIIDAAKPHGNRYAPAQEAMVGH